MTKQPPAPNPSRPPNLKLPLPLDKLPVLPIQPHDMRPPRSAVDVLEEVGKRGFLTLGFAFDLFPIVHHRRSVRVRRRYMEERGQEGEVGRGKGGGVDALLFGVLRTQPVIP